MNILGLKIVSHDTGAALISNEGIVAIAEERLNRVKHSFDMFPKLSIEYCLKHFNLKPKDIDLVVIDQTDLRSVVKTEEIFRRHTNGTFSNVRVVVINHHLAHAASAFYCSPFQKSAVLVSDGAGEKFKMRSGIYGAETETLYQASGTKIEEIKKTLHIREGKFFPYTFGIGKLYSFFSDVYLGFGKYNEGKMMGLAPYGDDSFLKQFPVGNFMKEVDGVLYCNSRVVYPHRITTQNLSPARIFYWLLYKTRIFFKKMNVVARISSRGTEEVGSKIFKTVTLPKPPRDKSGKLPDSYYASVAYAAQYIFERFSVALASQLKKITGSSVLCVAGGCGLNIDANMKFLTECRYDDVFIQPGCSDTGIALGCALYGYHSVFEKERFYEMKNASLGRPYTEEEVVLALDKFKNKVVFKKSSNVAKETAQFIAEGKIIGWVQGGSEYGPRALGNRSIIVDARDKEMKNTLNNRVKHREAWRPFAASVLRENVNDYFELDRESPFMLLAAPVREDKKSIIPSVVHVDGTCRIQTVTKEANGSYYELIRAFGEITGVPLVLNTSFNLGGDPIVETPEDALDTFTRTDIDYLIIEDYIIGKIQE